MQKYHVLLPILSPILVVTLREFIYALHIFSPNLFPSGYRILTSFIELLSYGESYHHIVATFYNAFLGWILASVLAIACGVLVGRYAWLYKIVSPMIHFFRSLPATALFPVFLLFFGIHDVIKIAISAFISMRIVLVATIDGVRLGNTTRYEAAKVLGIKGVGLLIHIVFFEALPVIMTGIKLALSMSMIVVIVVEMFVGSNFGIGQQLYDSYIAYTTPLLFARVLVIGLLGCIINFLFQCFEKRVLFRIPPKL